MTLAPLLLPLIVSLVAQAPEAPSIARYAGPEVAAIAHVDLTRIDLPALAGPIVARFVDEPARPDLNARVAAVQEQIRALVDAGATDVYVLGDPQAMPSAAAVIWLRPGANTQAIARHLQIAQAVWPETKTVAPNVLVAGTAQAIAQVEAAARQPQPRPEVVAALAETSASPVALTLVPSEVQRRAFEELVPTLPEPLGGGPVTDLTRGLRHAALSLTAGPEPALVLAVQAADPKAADALLAIVKKAQAAAPGLFVESHPLAGFGRALAALEPRAEGNRVGLTVTLAQAGDLVGGPIHAARDQAGRTATINNLKHMALAMHNFASATRDTSFPPAFSASPDGKPLLSWRVRILPYLDQQALYDQFHLDEPWDSPHNRTLIEQMPAVYACPQATRPGLTPYLVPRGPDTIFPGAQAIALRDIRDGMSNTILVVDAGPDHQVTWTKPDDWEIPAIPRDRTAADAPRLSTPWPLPFAAAFADGGVRMLSAKTTPDVLLALVTRARGELVALDAFW